MPIVEVSGETKRFDLKTAPPDGYVVLRRMSHGEALRRRDKSSQMSANAGRKKGKRDDKIYLDTNQEWMRHFDFQLSIVEHNLQHNDGSLFNFSNKAEFDRLPPNIGLEIEEAIDTYNGFDQLDDDEEEGATGSDLLDKVVDPLKSEPTPSSQEDRSPILN